MRVLKHHTHQRNTCRMYQTSQLQVRIISGLLSPHSYIVVHIIYKHALKHKTVLKANCWLKWKKKNDIVVEVNNATTHLPVPLPKIDFKSARPGKRWGLMMENGSSWWIYYKFKALICLYFNTLLVVLIFHSVWEKKCWVKLFVCIELSRPNLSLAYEWKKSSDRGNCSLFAFIFALL